MAGYRGSNINPKKFERGQIKLYCVLIPLAVVMAIPIVYIFCHAFKPMDELFAFPPKIFVSKPTWNNFRALFRASQSSGIPMSRYVFNSLIVTLTVVLASIIFSTMAAFALSKLKFKGKYTIMEINNAALMFVGVAVQIPRYLVIDTLSIKDNYLAHILPLLAMPVGLFLVKQFIDQVPDALIEAAYIDGAKDLTIYIKIILPLVKPAIATTAILAFQAVWTN
ncbi:MAG: carbohydrate ABC transporter permease, partial [Lachnospiraceae bacterium]|nr:carbohydrate ABC transporter permease [Lachnospiraceae bacterium]